MVVLQELMAENRQELPTPTPEGNSVHYVRGDDGNVQAAYGVNHAGQVCTLSQEVADRLNIYFVAQEVADKHQVIAAAARAEVERFGREEDLIQSAGYAGFKPFIDRCHTKEAQYAQFQELADGHLQHVLVKTDEQIGKLTNLSQLFAQGNGGTQIVADEHGAAKTAPNMANGGRNLS